MNLSPARLARKHATLADGLLELAAKMTDNGTWSPATDSCARRAHAHATLALAFAAIDARKQEAANERRHNL